MNDNKDHNNNSDKSKYKYDDNGNAIDVTHDAMLTPTPSIEFRRKVARNSNSFQVLVNLGKNLAR